MSDRSQKNIITISCASCISSTFLTASRTSSKVRILGGLPFEPGKTKRVCLQNEKNNSCVKNLNRTKATKISFGFNPR